jgi:Reverse transcriptase (RNA-dependent DNA polymerase)/RNase H-like domain found in reverse transcriptase
MDPARSLSQFRERARAALGLGATGSSRRRRHSPSPPSRSGRGTAATAIRNITITESARCSGPKSRRDERPKPKGEPAPTKAAPDPVRSTQTRMGATEHRPSPSSTASQQPAPASTSAGQQLLSGPGKGWQRQLNNWSKVAAKFNIPQNRYVEFQYLLYVDIENPYVINYVDFHLENAEPDFKNRLSAHLPFWVQLNSPDWLLEYINKGITIPFDRMPDKMYFTNHPTVLSEENIPVVRQILVEYLQYGFVEIVTDRPYCVLPLQLKVTAEKSALIYDMSRLNLFVQQSKFKLESWPEMYHYAAESEFAIKFDMKKFYHQVPVHEEFRKYFGFRYELTPGNFCYFTWVTMPYGYTRAPFIAKQLMKPLVTKWRSLGALTVVFYDDGMAVAKDSNFLAQLSVQMQCDLLNAGLVPGVKKCTWTPVRIIDWNGLTFNFETKGISIKQARIENTIECLKLLESNWPKVTFREVAKCTGKINSMYPVFTEKLQIRIRMLQTIVNIRHFKNLRWDDVIEVDYIPLYFHAYDEIIFWLRNIEPVNFRPFLPVRPDWICWTDASDVALGGCFIQMPCKNDVVPVTIDNVMLNTDRVFRELRRCVPLQADVFPWSAKDKVIVRNNLDSMVENTAELLVCHRNLSPLEQATSSTERELLAIYHVVLSAGERFFGRTVILHSDSQNAEVICTKGSCKPKLQAYAKLIHDYLDAHKIELKVVWIPRDLNLTADFISTQIDYMDYEIIPEAYLHVCNSLNRVPDIDLFADSRTAKCTKFFSATFSPGAAGVDAFNYDCQHLGYVGV